MRRRRTGFRLGLCLLLSSAGAVGSAGATGWVLEPGGVYGKIQLRAMRADRYYDAEGNPVAIPTLSQYTTSFYGEYGFHRRITGILYLPFHERLTLNRLVAADSGAVFFEGDANDGFGDAEAGLRVALRRDRPTVLSAGLVLGLPTGESEQASGLVTSDREYNQRLVLEGGHSARSTPLYGAWLLAWNHRTRGYSDEAWLQAEVGGRIGARVGWLARLRGLRSLENSAAVDLGGAGDLYANNARFLSLGGELHLSVSPRAALLVGAETATRGRNVLSGPALSAGFSWSF